MAVKTVMEHATVHIMHDDDEVKHTSEGKAVAALTTRLRRDVTGATCRAANAAPFISVIANKNNVLEI
jgi:hypothetical protein